MSEYFQRSRGRFKRITGYDRQPQQIITIVENNVTNSYNQNLYSVHRDFYFIQSANNGTTASSGPVFALYDEDYIVFTGGSTASKTFNILFSSTPAITLEIEPLDAWNDMENVIPVITALSPSSVTVALSAEFSGSVRYRAVYSPSYPALVVRSVLEPSLQYTALSVVSMSLSGSMTSFTASFPALGSPPSAIYYSIQDIFSYNDCLVAVESGSYVSDLMPVELSDTTAGAMITFMAVV